MSLFKKSMAVIMAFCVLVATASVSLLTLVTADNNQDPITYELYDYFEDIRTAYKNGTAYESDSPWYVEMQNSTGEWMPLTNIFFENSYYYGYLSGAEWGYLPGFAFYWPDSYTSGRLYLAMIGPTNSINDPAWRRNAAYAFKAPKNGTYKLDKANQDMVYAFDRTNAFRQSSSDASLSMGVRITVNGEAIWPKSDHPAYFEGWAKFGNAEEIKSVDVPTINDVKLKAGDIVRIEVTNFTPTDVAWAQRIDGIMSATLVSEDKPETPDQPLPITYEVYDYYRDIVEDFENNRELSSSSPWSVQMQNSQIQWVKPSAMIYENNYYYGFISNSYDEQWGYLPGLSFYWPSDYKEGDRLYISRLGGTNSAGSDVWRRNAAYTFTVPYTGVYTLGKANRALVYSFDDTDYFQQANTDDSLSLGVRITVNDVTIWPTPDHESYRNGWARFGAAESIKRVEVPTLEGLVLNKNDIVRVEVTNFTPTNTAYAQRANGLVSMTLTAVGTTDPTTSTNTHTSEPTSTTTTTPTTTTSTSTSTSTTKSPTTSTTSTSSTTPTTSPTNPPDTNVYYELYDYYKDIKEAWEKGEQFTSTSPWSVQMNINNVWRKADNLFFEGGYYFAYITERNWGYNPGFAFYWPNDYKTGNRLYLCRIAPTNSAMDDSWKHNAAYTFTVPQTGRYTFGLSDRDMVYAYDDADYFSQPNRDELLAFGVRITVNGSTIWPAESHEAYYQGWARFGAAQGEINRIQVPTITDMELRRGDVFRVEFTSFMPATISYPQRLNGFGRMILTEVLPEPVDNTAPVFNSGSLKMEENTATSITVSWPLAKDDYTYDEALVYKLYYDTSEITEQRLSTLQGIEVTGTSYRVTQLMEGTDYYFAVQVKDQAGNARLLKGGPFKTLSKTDPEPGGNEPEDNTPGHNITSPLTPNKATSDAGIMQQGSGSVTIGWNSYGGLSYYQVFVYTVSGSQYQLLKTSSKLDGTATQYTVTGLETNREYAIQIIGFNSRDEAFDIYQLVMVSFVEDDDDYGGIDDDYDYDDDDDDNGDFDDDDDTNQGGGGQDDDQTIRTQPTELVISHETVNVKPSRMDKILWIVLLCCGGVFLAANIALGVTLIVEQRKKQRPAQ